MNKRKLIYFLSAFVVIIGCYALNLSYSLFTQNISSESNVVDTSIPVLNASLEEDTFTISGNSGEVVTLKINNSGTANIQYGISISTLPDGINAYLVEKINNDIVGNLESNNNKEILVYVENQNTEENEVIFNLEKKYETISFDKDAFINNSNIDCVNKVKLLNESILARATSTEIVDENKTVYDEDFDSKNITGISGDNERKLIKTEDDYGTSYVFRGAVKDNYVNFAGFTWRIVRINGDGSIRLILDGTLDKVCADYEKNENGICNKYAGTISKYNSLNNNNTYMGYMYGLALNDTTNINKNRCLKLNENNDVTDYISTYLTKESCEINGGKWTTNSYEATHANVKDSDIKVAVDTFYENYIENNETNKHNEKYLADTLFCNDKTVSQNNDLGNNNYKNTMLGFGENFSYYSTMERLVYSMQTIMITIAKPTLKCTNGSTSNYSRMSAGKNSGENSFNMDTVINNNISINNDLKYPIALISSDELVLAGAWRYTDNHSYYLKDSFDAGISYDYWWLFSPSHIVNNYAYADMSSMINHSLYYMQLTINAGVRPVINLKAEVVASTGDGTKEITYDAEGNIISGPYQVG